MSNELKAKYTIQFNEMVENEIKQLEGMGYRHVSLLTKLARKIFRRYL
ncbi:hypothetical protein ABE236_18165 [Priestia endophytica]